MIDLDPPFPLGLPDRRHWDRLSKEIHGQGRWELVSHDLLAGFCQLLHLSQECLTAILADGVMVAGSAPNATGYATRYGRPTPRVSRT